jgi:hypothetical protein
VQHPQQPSPNPAPGPGTALPARVHRVVLVKGAHRWVLECDTPGRGTLVAHLEALVRRPGYPLDRFDVSMIEKQLLGGGEQRAA